MSRVKLITKYFIKNTIEEMFTNSKFKPRTMMILTLILTLMLSAPIVIFIVESYEIFHTIGQEGLLLSIILSLGSGITLFFGIYTLINSLYFSNDIQELLPLPFKASEIVFGKFVSVIINIYMYVSILILPIISYGIVSKASLIYYVYAIIVLLITPIFPMVLSTIICIVIMRFTNLSKHKDGFRMFIGSMSLILIVLVNFITRNINANEVSDKIISSSSNGNNNLFNNISGLFLVNKFSSYALLYSSEFKGFINICIALILSVIVFILCYYIGSKLYLKSIIGSSESYSKKENVFENSKLTKSIRKNSPLKALIIRDIRILFRTPQFFISCVAMLFYMPAILGISFFSDGIFSKLDMALNKNSNFYGIALVICVFCGTMCIITGGAGVTALSREGKSFLVSKYIPVDYKTQLNSKILSSLIVNEFGAIIVTLMLILLKVNIMLFILGTILSIASIALITLLAIYIDFKKPKLYCEDEKEIVKNNYLSLLIMLAIALICIFILVISMLFKNYIIVFIISIIIIILGLALLYKGLLKLAYTLYNE